MTDKDLYLEFRKTYLMLLEQIIQAIEKGDALAAEQYGELEESWKLVEEWYG